MSIQDQAHIVKLRKSTMTDIKLTIPQAEQNAIESFVSDASLLALPLRLDQDSLEALPFVCYKDAEHSFQDSLNLLNGILDLATSLYILVRHDDFIFAITFVPYRAPADQRNLYLHYRHNLLESLDEKYIEMSLICKEIGEITDTRSWTERSLHRQTNGTTQCTDGCEDVADQGTRIKDLGYKRNKCRLCDRRMKNKITDETLGALGELKNAGDCVQISLSESLVLKLDLQTTLPLSDISSHLPTTHPTFTFYRHSNTLLYFIFHSPDSASVQQRMKHTMAIPGLVNVHAKDCGVHVDQKIEIHEPGDLVFEVDEKVGRFRSVYLRGAWKGTESEYEELERDTRFYDAVE